MKRILLIELFSLALSIATFSQGVWQEALNAPTETRIDDIMFINDSVGFMGGGAGVLYKTSDKGMNWTPIGLAPIDYFYFRSIEFINDTLGYTGLLVPNTGGLQRTTDGGASFTSLDSLVEGGFKSVCGLDHKGDTLIAVGSFDGPPFFYKTCDNGQSFTKLDMSPFASALVECYMMNDSTYFLGGVSDEASGLRALILKTSDGGVTWEQVAMGAESNGSFSYCWKLFFLPGGVGFGAIENGGYNIFRSTDFGNTWEETFVGGNYGTGFGGVAFLNDTLGWIGMQNYSGHFQSTDGGLTWAPFEELFNVNRMVVVDSATALAAGVTIYKYNLDNPTSINKIRPSNFNSTHQINLYPNPASEKILIQIKLKTGTKVLLDILDQKRSFVKHITNTNFTSKGDYEIEANVNELKSGSYFILMRTNDSFLTKQFEIIK